MNMSLDIAWKSLNKKKRKNCVGIPLRLLRQKIQIFYCYPMGWAAALKPISFPR